MSLFSKAKEKMNGKAPEEINAGVVEPVLEKESSKPDLTDQEKVLRELIANYQQYTQIFSPQDIGNMSALVVKAEDLNLKFAIFAELNKLNKQLADIK